AVDMLRARGTGAGVVVDAGTLDFGAIACGGRVVDGDPQAAAAEQRLDGVQGADGHGVGLSADRANGGVGGAKLVGDTGSAKPGRHRAATAGEEDAVQQAGEAGGAALVQPEG